MFEVALIDEDTEGIDHELPPEKHRQSFLVRLYQKKGFGISLKMDFWAVFG